MHNGEGGAIVNTGDANINFSRIIGNSAINGSAIFNSGNLMDASLNWWGSNIDPSSNVYGNVTVTPWLILKMITSPKNHRKRRFKCYSSVIVRFKWGLS